MESRSYDVVVLGGGPGGYTAALYCARSGYSVAADVHDRPRGQLSRL